MAGPTTADTIAARGGRALVDALAAIAVVDERGDISDANERWCETSGLARDEVVGRHWRSLVHPDDLGATLAVARTLRHDGEPVVGEARLVPRDGRAETWVRYQVAPFATESGSPSWVVVAVDVSAHQRAHEELRQRQRRFDAILRRSPDVIAVVEPDGTLRSTTDRFDELFGVERPRMLGDVLAVVHPEDRGYAVRSFLSLLRRGDELYGKLYELRLCRPDGSVRWVETTGIDLVGEPAVGGAVLISRDVTARHEVEGQLMAVSSRLATLVEHAHLGVHLSDEEGRVLAVNPAFLAMTGLDGAAEDLVGRFVDDGTVPFGAVLAEPARDLPRAVGMTVTGLAVTDERFALANGRTVAVDLVPTAVAGEHRGRLWMVRDVTAEMAVAAERERLLEVERRHNARLSELDAMKSLLVSTVSHELRTPLTSIVSFTQLLRDGLGAEPVARQAEYLDVVGRNIDRLLRLVDELLTLDRLDATSGDAVGKVDPADVVGQAVSSIRPAAEAKGLTLRLRAQSGPAMVADARGLGQLVDNVLSNAVKFTPAGGRVDVNVRPLAGGWRLRVADTGIGIPVADQANLFQRFFRASNARRQAAPGSGLGLAIVHQVAEQHRGRVDLRSEEGVGTVVTVRLRGMDGDGIDPLAEVPPA